MSQTFESHFIVMYRQNSQASSDDFGPNYFSCGTDWIIFLVSTWLDYFFLIFIEQDYFFVHTTKQEYFFHDFYEQDYFFSVI